MKLQVKLFGNLQALVENYDKENGLEIEIPESMTAEEVIQKLGIPEKSAGVVIQRSIVLKKTDTLCGDHEVRILEPVYGG